MTKIIVATTADSVGGCPRCEAVARVCSDVGVGVVGKDVFADAIESEEKLEAPSGIRARKRGGISIEPEEYALLGAVVWFCAVLFEGIAAEKLGVLDVRWEVHKARKLTESRMIERPATRAN